LLSYTGVRRTLNPPLQCEEGTLTLISHLSFYVFFMYLFTDKQILILVQQDGFSLMTMLCSACQ